MKIDVTPAQLKAIKDMADDMSAMIGCDAEGDYIWERLIKHVDNMLKMNDLPPRNFN